MADMGLGTLGNRDTIFKMRYRWLFEIDTFSQGENGSLPALPPKTGHRPNITFNEVKVEHLIETVHFPMKGDWQSIELTLYDVTNTCEGNQIVEWLKRIYDAAEGTYTPVVDGKYKIPSATLTLFDGCGTELERWTFENVFPIRIDWGQLEMGTNEILTVDLTLKYDRAYLANDA
jgi:hypothetical protein